MALRTKLALLSLTLLLSAAAPPTKAPAKPPSKDPAKGSGISITLRNGNEMKGAFLGRHNGAVWVGLDGGEIGLDESTIVKIVPEASDDAEYLQRRAQVKPDDVNGWWSLCQWAHKKGLESSAQSAAETIIKLYPDHPDARAFLGYKKLNNVWYDADQLKLASGWKKEDGVWISPEDQQEEAEVAAKRARERARAKALMGSGRASPPIEEQGVPINSYNVKRRKW